MSKIIANPDSTVPVRGLPSPESRWIVQCLNCGYELYGQFCSHCGQRAVPPHPTVRELAGDAIAEFSGWDGKFAETIRTLIRKPGELTRQWLEGRRVRFITPLRLYLTASLVYFLVQAGVPRTPKQVSFDTGPALKVGMSRPSKPDVAAAAIQKALNSGKPLTQAELDSVAPSVAKAPEVMRPILLRFMTDPAGVFASMRHLAPRVLFAMLPFYAAILALFYRKRHYPEHLYFAIHLHSFVFIALTLVGLVRLARLGAIARLAHAGPTGQLIVQLAVQLLALAALLWIPVYAILALRRVYGGSIGVNLLKGVGVMTLYLLLAVPALLVTVTIAALT